jgi:Amt family ammonium transporter
MVLSFIGACLLWVGWFGFNAGSALAASSLATSAFINTHFAAAAAAIGWSIAEWIHNGKPTALGAISGSVAGLVAITPASGFVQPMSALAIGLLAGLFCFFMVFVVKGIFGYDDSLDAFGVHGAGGTLGALLTGLFATRLINPAFGKDAPTGAFNHRHTDSAVSCGQDDGSARLSGRRDYRSRPVAAQRRGLRPELLMLELGYEPGCCEPACVDSH